MRRYLWKRGQESESYVFYEYKFHEACKATELNGSGRFEGFRAKS